MTKDYTDFSFNIIIIIPRLWRMSNVFLKIIIEKNRGILRKHEKTRLWGRQIKKIEKSAWHIVKIVLQYSTLINLTRTNLYKAKQLRR